MSPLVMGSRRVTPPTGSSILERCSALEAAIEAGGAQLVPDDVVSAQEIIAKAGERVSLGGDHTVVVLAGATGSGKSSLFNALAGAELATVGARRPTTTTPTAAVWGDEPAGRLLDWLGIGQRHAVGQVAPTDAAAMDAAATDAAATDATTTDATTTDPTPSAPGPLQLSADGVVGSLDGLVLLDLPDVDSRESAHRAEAERVLQLCDVFVWVTDPQKYADAVLHDDFVTRLADHEAVMLVVLNQVDRLDEEAVVACRDDLVQLLAADGLPASQVLTTSATQGRGVPELKQRLANSVAGHHAATHRLATDLSGAVAQLQSNVGRSEAELTDDSSSALVGALARAAGVPVVLDAVEEDFRRSSLSRTGWIFTRWRRHLRADPLARLRLSPGSSVAKGMRDSGFGDVESSDVRAVLGRSSLPPATPAARSAVRLATRELTDRASAGLPLRWAEAVAQYSAPDETRLDEALDQAVVRTPLRARDPLWWRILGVLQWVFGVAAVAGLVWLVALGVVGWLQLPDLASPSLGPLPYPTVLLVGGLVLGVLSAALARALGRRGAVRRRRLVEKRLHRAISEVATDRVVGPTRGVLERHARTRAALDRATAGPTPD